MGKVTFVVEYEDGKEPTVHKGMEFIGGKVIGVSWRDLIESNNYLKVELEQLANFNPDWDRLEASQESWRELNELYQAALTRLEELKGTEIAHKDWSDKTDWVQDSDPNRFGFPSWGMHRADIMTKHIEMLEAKIAAGAVDSTIKKD